MGDHRLLLGDPAGATILPAAREAELSPLAHALVEEGREGEPPSNAAAQLESAVTDASQLTGKVERATTLFKEISQGRLDPAFVNNEVDALVGLLRKLDHKERFEDVLRIAHSLAMLLGLLERWLELLRALQSALSAAKRIGDAAGKAWALHELGTLNLVAGRYADADRMLSEAHDLRVGDTHGLEITERNLQVLCRQLRAQLHQEPRRSVFERILHRPAIALIVGAMVATGGGFVGAAIGSSHNAADTVRSSVPPRATETTNVKATTTARTNASPTTAATTSVNPTTTGTTNTTITGTGATGATGTNPQGTAVNPKISTSLLRLQTTSPTNPGPE